MISIVVPAYNEEEVIKDLIKTVKKVKLGDYELLIINDGSTDNTAKIVKKEAKKDRHIRLISHSKNSGLGAALRTGFAATRGEIIVTMDSDLTHPPKFILKLFEAMKKDHCDICIASRYVAGGGMKNVPSYRVLVSKFANSLFAILLRLKTNDTTAGFRMFKKSIFKKIKLTSSSFPIQLELTIRAERNNFIIKEVPFILVNRKIGQSKFRLKNLFQYTPLLLRGMFGLIK